MLLGLIGFKHKLENFRNQHHLQTKHKKNKDFDMVRFQS